MGSVDDIVASTSMWDVRVACHAPSGPWSLALDPGCARLVAVDAPAVVVRGEGEIPLGAGDLILVLDSAPTTVRGVGDVGGGSVGLLVGGWQLEDRLAHPFLAQMPPVLHLTAGDVEGRIATLLGLLREEVGGGAGSPWAEARLVELLFLEVLRAYLHGHCALCEESGPSWLRASLDPELRPVLAAIHTSPLEDWTVERLARLAGMSRTSFATRFTASMGSGPMHYVTRWRLHLGAQALRSRGATLAEAAEAAGYGSEAAFAKAFKRETGTAPGRFRRSAEAPAVRRSV